MDEQAVREAVGLLTGPAAAPVLQAALAASEIGLSGHVIRSVHRRGGSSASVVFDVDILEAGEPRATQLVAHVSTRSIPDGATVIQAEHLTIHVWRFPHDPYLPGLASALDPARVRELLDRVGGPEGEVGLRTRAYRPTRRAVVEVAIGENRGRVLYLKVLGGRTPDRVRARTEALADVHRRLGEHLPVPRLVGTSVHQGLIAMTALSGRTLRTLLVHGAPLPEPARLVELSRGLAGIPDVDSGSDPRRYADITRHVRHLGELLPDQQPLLARVAAAAATLTGPVGTVHGDLHDGQLLFDEDLELSGVLDVDGVGPGDLASDAGRLVAHIEAADLVADLAEPARSYPDRLWEAYGELVDPREAAKGAAAAWVGLATGPYRSHRPEWEEATRERLARAASWLERAT